MNTSQTLVPGTLLYNGDYRIIRVLGRGGFGITYLAENVNLEKLVAIKEFFPRGMYNREEKTGYASVGSRDNVEIAEKFKKKFLKEARRLARLHDDSIVAVSNAFEENGTAYYVMDFIEGNDLQTIVRDGGIMSVDRAIRYISQVGAALIYLHERRINHLDVKPANILVDPVKNRAVLIDFGLSKQYDENGRQTSTTPVGVSHGYAPKEQYNPGGVKDFSAPTDVYALAATLYFLLTGERPPTASELDEYPLDFPKSFPGRLRPVILKAMAYRRAHRYQSVADFLAALDEGGHSRTFTDDSPSEIPEVEVLPPSTKRRRWLIPAVISLLIILGGVGGYFILKGGENAPIAQTKTDEPKTDEKTNELELKTQEAVEAKKMAEDELKAKEEAQKKAEEERKAKEAEETKNSALAKVIHSTPRNFDLCVTWNGKTGFISESDWKKLSSNEKNQVTKNGLYVSGNGQRFLLALSDLHRGAIDWYEAMAKYGSHMPSLAQAQVMVNNSDAINNAFDVFGGESMSACWTRTEDKEDSTLARGVDMRNDYVSYFTKSSTCWVRAVAAVPVASAM